MDIRIAGQVRWAQGCACKGPARMSSPGTVQDRVSRLGVKCAVGLWPETE